jgi:UPF0755 protein
VRGGLAAVLLLAVGACAGAPGPIEQVTIPPGSSFAVVTDSLAAHHVIEHPRWFKLLARVRGLDRSVRAGVYQLARGSTAWSVMDALKRGDQLMLRITVPEGLTLAEIAPIAKEALGIPVDSFMAAANDAASASAFVEGAMSFEGLLLPETYLVPAGVSARGLVRIMAQQGLEAWDPAWVQRLDTLGMTRLHLLALASIIEGEARVNSERSVISAVYWNRIRKGMPLQADPTVQYAIQMATGSRKPRLLLKDYGFKSPYNTYLNTGLPPGPVNSPGRASIEAALYPAPVPYLFFVAAGDGHHVFTRTYGEHLRAIARIRRSRGPQVVDSGP